MTAVPGECAYCGHPGLRPEGHAEWCADIAAQQRQHRDYHPWGGGRAQEPQHGTRARYRKGCRDECCLSAEREYRRRYRRVRLEESSPMTEPAAATAGLSEKQSAATRAQETA